MATSTGATCCASGWRLQFSSLCYCFWWFLFIGRSLEFDSEKGRRNGIAHGTLISVLGLGLILGLRHALDPDHIVAVSTIVSETKSVRRSSLIGTFWGLGHTMSLLIAGVVVIALKVQISNRFALWLEFVVALMLVLLG